jgi:hypothetical protein
MPWLLLLLGAMFDAGVRYFERVSTSQRPSKTGPSMESTKDNVIS